MLSLLFVCCGVIKFHLSPTHTYISSTIPIDHDLVVKNQLINKDQNGPLPRLRSNDPPTIPQSLTPIIQCKPVVFIPCWMIQALKSPLLAYSFSHGKRSPSCLYCYSHAVTYIIYLIRKFTCVKLQKKPQHTLNWSEDRVT